MKTLQNINIKDKTILLRADLDISDGGDLRLQAVIPTINYLLENNCKIIIIGHFGRPEGKVNLGFSLKPVFEKLKTYFSDKNPEDFKFISNIFSEETKNSVKSMESGDIAMFENLRFYPGEESNDLEFAKYLSEFADVFVNDAFAVCHRKHASTVGILKFLPSCAGLRLEKEIEVLTHAMQNPKNPAVAIIGGAKIETKLPCVESLAKVYDYVLVGGKVGVEMEETKKRRNEETVGIGCANPRIEKLENVVLPIDYVGEDKFDIGDKTAGKFREVILKAKTVVWNGPMGKFEDERFIHGTKMIADAIIESEAYSIVGGGDTIVALNKFGLLDKFSWVSTGGGAMLEIMSGKKLVGVEALDM